MTIGIVVFPGSNCDRDAYLVLKATGCNPIKVWHADTTLPDCDLVVVPGGFSYGDYLRSGAMAAHSPIMGEIKRHAEKGKKVLGICNGFQILTESGLLPGTLLRNAKLKFLCRNVHLRVEQTNTPFTSRYSKGQVITIPIAHHDGNYYAEEATLRAVEDNGQVAFRYCEADGSLAPEANPNGSAGNIAGVFSQKKNVLGMMPHPERHAELLTGGIDGVALFESLLAA